MTAPTSVLAVIQGKIAAANAVVASAKAALEKAQAEADKQSALLAQHVSALGSLLAMPREEALEAWRYLGTHLFDAKGQPPVAEAPAVPTAPAASPSPTQVAAAPVLTDAVVAPQAVAPVAEDPGIVQRIVTGAREVLAHAIETVTYHDGAQATVVAPLPTASPIAAAPPVTTAAAAPPVPTPS